MVGVSSERVVAVVAALDTGRVQIGSGYLVDGRRVVTAAHCTVDRKTGQPARSLKVVRRSDGAQATATVLASSSALDVAVMAVAEEAPWPAALPAPRWGRVARERTGVVDDCVAVGYPLWQLDETDGWRSAAEVHGQIYATEDVEAGRMVLRDPALTDVAPPASVAGEDLSHESPWGGLSGALVFWEDTAVGVVTEHRPRKGGSAISLVPVERLARAADEDQAVAAALGLTANRLALVDPGDDGRVRWPHRVGVVPPEADSYQDRASAAAALHGGRQPSGTVIVAGLGGTGKTQLVAAEAQTCWEAGELDLLVWISASSRDAIVSGYAQAAWDVTDVPADEPTEARAARLMAWLATTDRRWLVVLDDVRDPAHLRELSPAGPAGGVIITTRRRDDALTGDDRQLVEVDSFSPADALAYLSARLETARLDEAAELAADLAGLPLALAQAASYISDRDLSCASYRHRLAGRRLELVLPAEAPADDYPAIVATTWSLSIEAADRCQPTGLAAPALALASVLDPNGIPANLFTSHAARRYMATVITGGGGDAVVVDGEVDRDDAGDALRVLGRFSLVTLAAPAGHADEGSVRVNGLVQRATREGLPAEGLTSAGRAAADALLEVWPEADYAPQVALLVQSLRTSTVLLEAHDPDAVWIPGAHRVLFRAGNSLLVSGLATAAVAYFEHLTARSVDTLGADHRDVLTSRNYLAVAYQDAGRRSDALPLLERNLADSERVLGADHPQTLTGRNNLAMAYRDAGRIDDALPLLERNLADCERVLGADHPETLTGRNNLGLAYHNAGRLDDALQLYERTLADRERVLGADHPDILATRNNLAIAYQDAGRIDDALPLFERTRADAERLLGDDHPTTLASRNSLAVAYWNAGRLDDALPLLERTLTDRERVLGADHPDTLETRYELSGAYREAGRLDDALPLLKRSLADCERLFGGDDSSIATLLCRLASVELALGDPSTAMARLTRAVAIDEAAYGPDDPEVATDLEALGAIQEENGDASAAVVTLRRAAHIRLATEGSGAASVVALQNRITRLEAG